MGTRMTSANRVRGEPSRRDQRLVQRLLGPVLGRNELAPLPVPVRRGPVAVVLHLYYPERWAYIKNRLGYLAPDAYDLFVTLNEKDLGFVEEIRALNRDADIRFVPNRGRDILPFLQVLPALDAAGYDCVLKLHSKKTLHRANGNDWFEELVGSLLPDTGIVADVVSYLRSHTCLIGPRGHYVSLERYMGSNKPRLKKVLEQIYGSGGTGSVIANAAQYGFFAGSMFWASTACLRPLSKLPLRLRDFRERGDIDGTTAHAVERAVSLVTVLDEHELLALSGEGLTALSGSDISTAYKYVD